MANAVALVAHAGHRSRAPVAETRFRPHADFSVDCSSVAVYCTYVSVSSTRSTPLLAADAIGKAQGIGELQS